MLTKGDYSKLSCAVYVQWRRFSPCRWQGFYCHVIQHFRLYVSLRLCFFSKGALLGKGNPHRTLGWLLGGQPVFLGKKNGLSGDNPFFYEKKTGCPRRWPDNPFFYPKKTGCKTLFLKETGY